MAVDEATRWDVFAVVASGAALIGTVVALRLGASPHRWGPVVGFLVLWAGTANYVVVANVAARRRALRLQNFSPPIGVPLSRPLWILLREFMGILSVAAPLGTVAAGLGFPSVGAGIALALGATGIVPLLPIFSGPVGLTFESLGLRLHVRGDAACFVPWTSMVEVTVRGPAHHRPVNVRIVDPGRMIASVTPDNPRNRGRVRTLLWTGEPSGEAMSLAPWVAGLDSLTLARLLREAKGGPSQPTN